MVKLALAALSEWFWEHIWFFESRKAKESSDKDDRDGPRSYGEGPGGEA